MNIWDLHMLEIQDLTIRYGNFLAVNNVSLRIPKGQIIALIGPNGAGKSSIVRAIGGLNSFESGRITFLNKNLMETEPYLRIVKGLSIVPEGRGLFPRMSVEENLLMGSYSFKNKGLLDELLNRNFELFPILKERRQQLVGTMSGGQQQMVAVAVGLMSNPKLCIFDEPSLGLAPIVIEQIGDAFISLKKQDLTVFLVEQNASLTTRVADLIYVLSAGEIKYFDSPVNLMNNSEVLESFLSV
jgi:branched-chain amino acid transport system ATP-binding protein